MADPPRRVNFIEGMLLTAADLAAEQQYHREMRYLHNRLHGYGTASGLEVTVTKGRIRVTPGTGIDVQGREIVVTAPLTLRLGSHGNAQHWVGEGRTRGEPARCVIAPRSGAARTALSKLNVGCG